MGIVWHRIPRAVKLLVRLRRLIKKSFKSYLQPQSSLCSSSKFRTRNISLLFGGGIAAAATATKCLAYLKSKNKKTFRLMIVVILYQSNVFKRFLLLRLLGKTATHLLIKCCGTRRLHFTTNLMKHVKFGSLEMMIQPTYRMAGKSRASDSFIHSFIIKSKKRFSRVFLV